MESQPQNPEFRNNPENFSPVFTVHMKSDCILSYQAQSEDADHTGQMPRLI